MKHATSPSLLAASIAQSSTSVGHRMNNLPTAEGGRAGEKGGWMGWLPRCTGKAAELVWQCQMQGQCRTPEIQIDYHPGTSSPGSQLLCQLSQIRSCTTYQMDH